MIEVSGKNKSAKERLDNGVMLFENTDETNKWLAEISNHYYEQKKAGSGFWFGKEYPEFYFNPWIKGEKNYG